MAKWLKSLKDKKVLSLDMAPCWQEPSTVAVRGTPEIGFEGDCAERRQRYRVYRRASPIMGVGKMQGVIDAGNKSGAAQALCQTSGRR